VLSDLPVELEEIAKAIVDSAFQVHSQLGPGLLESVYEACLACELVSRGFDVKRQLHVSIVYRDMKIDSALRIDLLVNGRIIVELKAVEQDSPLYAAQLKTYLKLTGLQLGLVINFNKALIRDRIRRVILSEQK